MRCMISGNDRVTIIGIMGRNPALGSNLVASFCILAGLLMSLSSAQNTTTDCLPRFIPYTAQCSGHGVCAPAANDSSLRSCICNEGWSNEGDIFSVPLGADCITHLPTRTALMALAYVLVCLRMILIMHKVLSLRPWSAKDVILNRVGTRYLFQKQFLLFEAGQAVFELAFFCILLFGNTYLYKSIPAAVMHFTAGIFGHLKAARHTHIQIQIAMKGVADVSTRRTLKPFSKYMMPQALVQLVKTIIVDVLIVAPTSMDFKIGAYRAELVGSSILLLIQALLQVVYCRQMISTLEAHVKSSPDAADVAPIQEAIKNLRPMHLTASFVFPLIVVYCILTAIFPTSHTYFPHALWCFAALGDFASILNTGPTAAPAATQGSKS